MDTNHCHAICEGFKKMKNPDIFLSLSKIFYNIKPSLFQNNVDFKNINYTHENICDLYFDAYIFIEISKLIKKTTPLKKINKVFLLPGDDNEDVNDNLLKTMNNVILINRLKKSLNKKSKEDIVSYELTNKIHKSILDILPDLHDPDLDLSDFTYDNIHSINMSDEDYFSTFESLKLFI